MVSANPRHWALFRLGSGPHEARDSERGESSLSARRRTLLLKPVLVSKVGSAAGDILLPSDGREAFARFFLICGRSCVVGGELRELRVVSVESFHRRIGEFLQSVARGEGLSNGFRLGPPEFALVVIVQLALFVLGD